MANRLLVTYNRPQAVTTVLLVRLMEARVFARHNVVAKGIKPEVVVPWGSTRRSARNQAS